MGEIKKITQLSNNRFLNLYEMDTVKRTGAPGKYYVASRAKTEAGLKLHTKRDDPDGVVMYMLYGEARDKVVLVHQYRYTLDGWIYEFPAGLVDPGENYQQAATREVKEETGLDLTPLTVDPMYEKPYYMTIGMTDECCATVYGYASGNITTKNEEDSEEIEVVIADRAMVRKILKEERVATCCAAQLMHFIQDEDPFAFLNADK